MSTIIKASDRNRAVQPVAFNLDDVRDNAEQYLAKVRQQAGQILLDAQQKVGVLRTRAEAEGRRIGEAQIDQKVDARFQALAPVLQRTLAELQRLQGAWLAQWEKQAIHLAAAIAARVIRRELRQDPNIPVELVREALTLAVGSQSIVVKLHPQDYAAIGDKVSRLAGELARLARTEVVADPNIEPGGCRVELDQGSIDQQFAAQLDRIEQELV